MSFWRTFGISTVSAIDTLLEKPDCTLEELYDDDEFLQECKSQNRRLLDFLTEPARLEQIVGYIVTEAPEGSDDKRALKYPFMSSEILSSEVVQLVDAVYAHPTALRQIYGFLLREPPAKPTISNCCTKVAMSLMQRKVPETLELLRTIPNVVSRIVVHLGSPGVMDLLLKLVTADEGTGVDVYGTVRWLCDENLVELLVERYVGTDEVDVQENVAQALTDLITVTTAQASSVPSPIITQLESEGVVTKLIQYILAKRSSSVLQSGLGILIELLRKRKQPVYDAVSQSADLPPLVRVVAAHLGDCQGLLTTAPSDEAAVDMTYGVLQPPLGLERQCVIELVEAFALTNSSVVFDALVASPVLQLAIELFFRYVWNSFLHQSVQNIVTVILQSEHAASKNHILETCRLLDLILEAEALNTAEYEATNVSRGYIAVITKVATLINTTAAGTVEPARPGDAAIQALLDARPQWKEYTEGVLARRVGLESQLLGGTRPTAPAPLDEGEQGGEPGAQTSSAMYRIGGISSMFEQQEIEETPDDGEIGACVFDPSEFEQHAPFLMEERQFAFDPSYEDDGGSSDGDRQSDDEDDLAEEDDSGGVEADTPGSRSSSESNGSSSPLASPTGASVELGAAAGTSGAGLDLDDSTESAEEIAAAKAEAALEAPIMTDTEAKDDLPLPSTPEQQTALVTPFSPDGSSPPAATPTQPEPVTASDDAAEPTSQP